MSHCCHMMVDGGEFWITCKRLEELRKAGWLQLIQNSAASTIVWCQCDIRIVIMSKHYRNKYLWLNPRRYFHFGPFLKKLSKITIFNFFIFVWGWDLPLQIHKIEVILEYKIVELTPTIVHSWSRIRCFLKIFKRALSDSYLYFIWWNWKKRWVSFYQESVLQISHLGMARVISTRTSILTKQVFSYYVKVLPGLCLSFFY